MAMCKVSTTVHFIPPQTVVGERPAHWIPNTDIYSTDEGLVIKVELAGMRSENLQITVEGSQLRISGQRPDSCRGPKVSFLAMEIRYGSFENVLDLPAGYDLSQAKASYLNGFLRIDVPHAEKPVPKRTRVTVTGK